MNLQIAMAATTKHTERERPTRYILQNSMLERKSKRQTREREQIERYKPSDIPGIVEEGLESTQTTVDAPLRSMYDFFFFFFFNELLTS